MIPIKDAIKSHTTPWVNYLFILINIAVFAYQISLGPKMEQFVAQYALVPAEIKTGLDSGDFVRIFVSMFMHAGWLHIGGNLLYLWIFGDNVEDALGHFGYFIFYLAAGIVAAFAHYFFNAYSQVPTVGASGAIAGILGGYLALYPSSRVYTFIPLGWFSRLTLLPAFVILGMWFVMQLFNGFLSIGLLENQGGTAYWAHIGGFVFGLLMGYLFRKKERPYSAYHSW